MKTLLAILAFMALSSTVSSSIVDISCSTKQNEEEIEYSLAGNLHEHNDRLVITIEDFDTLTNVQAWSSDPNILSVSGPDENGDITVIAMVDEGEATIYISADDCETLEIPLEIVPMANIDAELSPISEFREGETTSLIIHHYERLRDIQISASPNNTVDIGPLTYQNSDAIAQVTGVGEGNTTITINALNAYSPVELFAKVNPKIQISASLDHTDLRIGESATLTINDASELKGLQVTANPSENVEIGTVNPDGTVTITAKESGEVRLTIAANNGIATSVDLNIVQRIGIVANLDHDHAEIGDTVNISVNNFNDLVNLQVSANNPSSVDIGPIDGQGNVAIKILAGGQIIFNVTAANATGPFVTTVTIDTAVAIAASLNQSEIYTEGQAVLSLDNYPELISPTIQASPSASVRIDPFDNFGKATITGSIEGNVVLTINAENAEAPMTLNLTVKPRIAIDATIDSSNLKVGQSTSIRVINPDQFLNLQVTADPSESAEIGTMTPDGAVVVKALKPGTITFNISADNGVSKQLTLNVDQKIAIQASIGDTNLWTGDQTTLTIDNYDQLVNAQITASPSDNVQIGAIDAQGRATITTEKSGQTTVTINADNASNPYQFILNIQDKIQISATLDKNSLKVGESATLTIDNYSQLQGVSISADPEANVEISAINNQGIATIKALNSGSVTLTISADNGISQQLTLNIDVKIAIDATIDKTDLWIGEMTTLTITNFDELVNLQVQAIPTGSANIGQINDQGQIQINVGQTGQIQITISADNASDNKTFTLNVSDKVQIEAEIDNPTLKVGETATITVTNFQDLNNLQAVADQPSKVMISPVNPDGTFTVKALDSGAVNIILSADNGVNKTIAINIEDKIAIETQVDQLNLWVGGIANITVTNFDSLVNLKVSVDNPALASVSVIDGDGHLTLAAVGIGTVVLTFTADNAIEPKTINFNLNQKIMIDATIDKTNLKIGETATITISNPSQLTGISVAANPSGNVELGPLQPDGTISVKAIGAGVTTITVSADNGISKVITIGIAQKITINASADFTDLWIGRTATVTISNFDQLVNLSITNPSGNLDIGPINSQGQVQVTATAIGATTLTINADNALAPLNILFNITPQVQVAGYIADPTLYVGDTTTIVFSNYTDLVNPQISVSAAGILEIGPINNQGVANVSVIGAGPITVTLSADNGISKDLILTVSPRLAIDASIDKTNLRVGETATITINNLTQLINLQISAAPSGIIQIGAIGSDGTITVKALMSGSATITVTADNGETKQFSIVIADKIDINASVDYQNLWVGRVAILTITNFDQLINLQVSANVGGIVQIGAINAQGEIALTGLIAGNITLTISADNATTTQTFDFTVTNKVDIAATMSNQNLYVGDSATITITNYLQLFNAQVNVSIGGILQITAINPDGTIGVTALGQGSVTITISADNGNSITFSVSVTNKITIAATIDKTNLRIGETATLTITNPGALNNLQVTAVPSGNVQIGAINPDGTVSIKGLAAGVTTINVTADNGITMTLTVTIAAKIAIQATADQSNIYIGNTVTITIANFASLVNVQAVADGGGNVSVGAINSQGQATVTGINAGSGTVTISADNGITPVVLTFTVGPKLTINATMDKTTIRVGETATLTIANFASLVNLQTTTVPNGSVFLGAMNSQGQIIVTGLTAGTTTVLSITATNGITVTFNITVPSLVVIDATASPSSIPLLGTSTITINNINQLVNVTATVIQNPALVSINTTNLKNGTIVITAIGVLKGTVIVRIIASNAVAPKDISIVVGSL